MLVLALVPALQCLAGVVLALIVRPHQVRVPRVRVREGHRLFGLTVSTLCLRRLPVMGLGLLAIRGVILGLVHSSPSRHSRHADEGCQGEQSSSDFVSVVAHMQSLTELPEAPSENLKIPGFQAALEDDAQLVSSYHLPVGGASSDILTDIDDHISSPFSGMLSKKVSKLLPYPGVSSISFLGGEVGEGVLPQSPCDGSGWHVVIR